LNVDKGKFIVKIFLVFAVLQFVISAQVFAACNVFQSNTRSSAVAGMFYPKDKDVLEKALEDFASRAKILTFKDKIVGALVPHAGWVYSGKVAAAVFKQVNWKRYNVVVLLAPSHYGNFTGVALPTFEYYSTPLGKVKVAGWLASRLYGKRYFTTARPAEEREHAIEVELPFIQYLAKREIEVLPLLVGWLDLEMAYVVASALYKALEKERALIVISSDFAHYKPLSVVRRMDDRALEKLVKLDEVGLYKLARSGEIEMCGLNATLVALKLLKLLYNGCKGKVVATATSADTTGDTTSVVGYAGLVFTAKGRRVPMFSLTDEDKRYLLELARKTIEAYLSSREVYNAAEEVEELVRAGKLSSNVLEKAGAFVTLNRRSVPKEKALRGCIGYIIGTQPLWKTVQEAAIAAAVHDPRFPPVTLDELPSLEVEISVLTPLYPISPEEVIVGKHGLYIKKGWKSGLLLPQVPVEWGWDREEFLQHVCFKAGLPPDAWQDKDTQLYAFEALVFSESNFEGKK